MSIDALINRIRSTTFDREFSDTSRDLIVTGLELVKVRFQLYAGEGPEGAPVTFYSAHPSLDLARLALAGRLAVHSYEGHVFDALTGTIVWTSDDHDRASGLISQQ